MWQGHPAAVQGRGAGCMRYGHPAAVESREEGFGHRHRGAVKPSAFGVCAVSSERCAARTRQKWLVSHRHPAGIVVGPAGSMEASEIEGEDSFSAIPAA